MSTTNRQLNYPLLAIPGYYVFSLLPHVYASAILSANGYKINNANPKASLSPSAVQGKVPDAVFQRYQRAESAHSNSQEQMPLFIAAILASLLAETATVASGARGVSDELALTTFIGRWFIVRSFYTVAYIVIGKHELSFLRSTAWAVGTGLATWQIWKAANVLG